MPNWTSNSLTITGDNQFLKDIESAPDYDFIRHLIPLPADLENIASGAMRIDGVAVNEWRAVGAKAVALTDLERQHFTDVHGAVNALDWARANWGTKWSARDVKVDGNRVYFDSAWTPPHQAIRTISEMYPDATFTIAYAEGGAGFWGRTVWEDGTILDNFESTEFWDPTADPDDDGYPYSNLSDACELHIWENGLHCGG